MRRHGSTHTVISAARGGVFKHFAHGGAVTTDAGLIVETADGRVAVSEQHDLGREITYSPGGEACSLTVGGPLAWTRFETMTPLKQMVLHAGMYTVGRWCRTAVRRVLQCRLITGRRPCGIRLARRFELFEPGGEQRASLRVTDTIELVDPRLRVRRMSFGADHQSAYVAASGVYQSRRVDSLDRPGRARRPARRRASRGRGSRVAVGRVVPRHHGVSRQSRLLCTPAAPGTMDALAKDVACSWRCVSRPVGPSGRRCSGWGRIAGRWTTRPPRESCARG